MKRALPLLLVLASCKEAFDDYQSKSKRTEAELMLNRLGKNLKVYSISANQPGFPILTLGPTPAQPCCTQPKATCAPNAADWTAWQPLEFSIEDPFRFQYTYTSDGQTFTATAIGDLDCDTNNVVYKLTGKIENGVAMTNVERPTNTD